jgi:hypothetical protein
MRNVETGRKHSNAFGSYFFLGASYPKKIAYANDQEPASTNLTYGMFTSIMGGAGCAFQG